MSSEGQMARALGKLTALKVEKAKQAGMYADGGGLYLRVTGAGRKRTARKRTEPRTGFSGSC